MSFQHPVYEILHRPCGHRETKKILEGTEGKRQAVKRAMELKRCAKCIKESQP